MRIGEGQVIDKYRCVRLGEGNRAMGKESCMKIRIDLRTYKVVYEGGSEEVLWRGVDKDEEVLRERARVREDERRKSQWLMY